MVRIIIVAWVIVCGLAGNAAAQIGSVPPPPIPNGLSGPGGRETFTPSPLPSTGAVAGVPYVGPIGPTVRTRAAPARRMMPRVRK